MMSRFVYIVSFALLLVLAFALGASATEPSPASGAALASPDTQMVQPKINYHIKLACYSNDKLIMESELATTPGYNAQITSVSRFKSGKIDLAELILVGPADPAQAVNSPIPYLHSAPQPVLDAAQHYSFAGLLFSVYCPRANRFAAEVYSSKPGSTLFSSAASGVEPYDVDPPESEWTYLGRLSAALDTPDVGFIDQGEFWQSPQSGDDQ
jgi:hypothetical protein